jgi:hypothetical protein
MNETKPHPAHLVIDKRGKVAAVFAEKHNAWQFCNRLNNDERFRGAVLESRTLRFGTLDDWRLAMPDEACETFPVTNVELFELIDTRQRLNNARLHHMVNNLANNIVRIAESVQEHAAESRSEARRLGERVSKLEAGPAAATAEALNEFHNRMKWEAGLAAATREALSEFHNK